jgi:hypothetical protein
VALETKIPGRIERDVLVEVRTVELVATEAGDRLLGAGIDDLGTDRMADPMGRLMAIRAQRRSVRA